MGPVFRVRQQDELGVLVSALVVAVRVGVRQWGCLFRSSVGPSTSHSRPGWAPLLPTLTHLLPSHYSQGWSWGRRWPLGMGGRKLLPLKVLVWVS